jgi:hypothetical protein
MLSVAMSIHIPSRAFETGGQEPAGPPLSGSGPSGGAGGSQSRPAAPAGRPWSPGPTTGTMRPQFLIQMTTMDTSIRNAIQATSQRAVRRFRSSRAWGSSWSRPSTVGTAVTLKAEDEEM